MRTNDNEELAFMIDTNYSTITVNCLDNHLRLFFASKVMEKSPDNCLVASSFSVTLHDFKDTKLISEIAMNLDKSINKLLTELTHKKIINKDYNNE